MPDIAWPPHAYVPGQTARHPEDWFDAIKATVQPGTPAEELHHSVAWQTGLAYLNAGYFWECHEVLEAVWMQTPDPSPQRAMTQALIQLANARLKHRMGKPNAVRRLCEMALGHLQDCPQFDETMGLKPGDIEMQINATFAKLAVW